MVLVELSVLFLFIEFGVHLCNFPIRSAVLLLVYQYCEIWRICVVTYVALCTRDCGAGTIYMVEEVWHVTVGEWLHHSKTTVFSTQNSIYLE